MEKILGVYLGEQDDRGHRYFFFNSDENDGRSIDSMRNQISVFKKRLGKTTIGAVYGFEREGETISYSKNPKPLDYWKNTSEVMQWKSISRAFADSKLKLKPKDEQTLVDTLQPIKDMYRSCSYKSRAYLLGEVIRIITNM